MNLANFSTKGLVITGSGLDDDYIKVNTPNGALQVNFAKFDFIASEVKPGVLPSFNAQGGLKIEGKSNLVRLYDTLQEFQAAVDYHYYKN